jgi:hypothetical protein
VVTPEGECEPRHPAVGALFSKQEAHLTVGFSQHWGLIAAAAVVTLGGVTNLGHRH